MAYFSKFNIGGTSYDVKDAAAGKSLAVNGTSLSLKNAAGTAISTVTLPGGGSNDPIVIQISYAPSSASIYPQNFNHTSLTYNTFTYDAIDAEGNVYPQTVDAVMLKILEGFPTTFKLVPDSSIIATVSKSELTFTLQSIGNVSGTDDVILTFESDIDNGYVYQIVLTIDQYTYNISSCYGEKITLGGGSNGICLTLKTTTGNNMPFAQCIENTSFRLYDSSTNTNKTFTEILAAYAAGIPIIIQDSSPEYTTINFVSGNQQWINFTYQTGPWSSTMYSLACSASGNTFTVNGRKQVF